MDVLTGITLSDALKACDMYDGARIGVVCASGETAKTMIESFWLEISGGKMPGWEIGREVNGCHATLRKKGKRDYSTIEIFPATSDDEIRGKSYHLVLYERYLDAPLINALQWCERLSFDDIEEDGREKLNEFLNSFKIV